MDRTKLKYISNVIFSKNIKIERYSLKPTFFIILSIFFQVFKYRAKEDWTCLSNISYGMGVKIKTKTKILG